MAVYAERQRGQWICRVVCHLQMTDSQQLAFRAVGVVAWCTEWITPALKQNPEALRTPSPQCWRYYPSTVTACDLSKRYEWNQVRTEPVCVCVCVWLCVCYFCVYRILSAVYGMLGNWVFEWVYAGFASEEDAFFVAMPKQNPCTVYLVNKSYLILLMLAIFLNSHHNAL